MISHPLSARASSSDGFDPNLFQHALAKVEFGQKLPAIPIENAVLPQLAPDGERLSQEIENDFLAIQRFVFGTDKLLSLRACASCVAQSEASVMSVFLQPSYFEKLRVKFASDSRDVSRLIVAHEISHYIHEYMTLETADGLSPQKHIPLLRRGFFDFIDGSKYMSLSLAEQKIEMQKYLVESAKSHAEVDGIAILVLRQMGFDAVPAAVKLLSEMLRETKLDPLLSIDIKARLKSMQNLRRGSARASKLNRTSARAELSPV